MEYTQKSLEETIEEQRKRILSNDNAYTCLEELQATVCFVNHLVKYIGQLNNRIGELENFKKKYEKI